MSDDRLSKHPSCFQLQGSQTKDLTNGATYTGPLSDCTAATTASTLNLIKPLSERNQPNGFGKIVYGSQDRFYRYQYLGDFLCGHRHGKGAMRWQDSGLYVGQFEMGVRQGEGRMVYPNGDVYEGEWANNKKNGRGTYWWKDSGHQ